MDIVLNKQLGYSDLHQFLERFFETAVCDARLVTLGFTVQPNKHRQLTI